MSPRSWGYGEVLQTYCAVTLDLFKTLEAPSELFGRPAAEAPEIALQVMHGLGWLCVRRTDLHQFGIPDFNPNAARIAGDERWAMGFKFPENKSRQRSPLRRRMQKQQRNYGRRRRRLGMKQFYILFFGLGHLASTVVPIPPRGRNTPFTIAHFGLQARVTSSSTWFTMFSWKMPRLR